jgi:hypothetical protein
MSADNIDGNILELTNFRKEKDRIIKADNPQGLIKGIDQITYRFCLNRLISAMAFTCVGYGNSQLTKKTTLDENKAEIDFIDGQNVSDIEDYLNDKSDYHDHTEEVGFREPEKIKPSVFGGYKHLIRLAIADKAMYERYPFTGINGAIKFLLESAPMNNTNELIEATDEFLTTEEEQYGLDTELISELEKAVVVQDKERSTNTLRENAPKIMEMVQQGDKCTFEDAWHDLPTLNQFKILKDLMLVITKSIARKKLYAKRNIRNAADNSGAEHEALCQAYARLKEQVDEMRTSYGKAVIDEAFDNFVLADKYA